MDKIGNINLLNEMYLPDYQYRDDLEFTQERFNGLAMHGIHNYYNDDTMREGHLCTCTFDIVHYMRPYVFDTWIKGLFDENPDVKARLLKLNKVSKYMARSWLSVLIGKNKLKLFNELDINDIPFGVCFMGALALEDYYDVLKKVDFKLGTDKEKSIIRPMIVQYAKAYTKEEFSRAINFTLTEGRYAEFWFKDDWDNIAWDSWLNVNPKNFASFSSSYTGLYKQGEAYTINYNGNVIDVFSDDFIKTLEYHRHLDGLYYYLFKNPNKESEISDEDFFKEMGINIEVQREPDWTYYKC